MDIMKMIEQKDLLSFSQNFKVQRNYLGDRLFPDVKTQHLKAEFYRLSDQRMLPTMAQVHALDTEAHIGQRPTMEKVQIEKMLIKEKINLSERVQMWLDNGAAQDSLVKYIFDDAARLAESVKTRTEVAKMEALCTGKITVNENGAKFGVDYHVPPANMQNLDWSDPKHDILGDIQALLDKARLAGQLITTFYTSTKVVALMRKNEGIQTSIYSALGKGTFVSNALLSSLLNDMFGVTVVVNDQYYQYEGAKGALSSKRYFDENKFVGVSALANGSIGSGLWGATPEERAQGPWTAKNMQQYITITAWSEPDPVATWTKASGMFIPVIPNPAGMFINTVKLA